MSSLDRPAPDRPDPARLRREAKRLKKAFAAGDVEAVERVRAYQPDAHEVRHADALFVLAREHGYASWPRLIFATRHAGQDRSERGRVLMRALFFGQAWMIDALLDDDPELSTVDPALRIALFDDDWVVPWLDADPSRATAPLGRRTPLLHLAFSQRLRSTPERQGAMLRIAERLLDLGADPNDGYAPDPNGDTRLSALYGALAHADNEALAELLLARGATPNDNESLYHSTELPHTRGLALLLEHGATTRGTNALLRALDIGDPVKVRMLLEAGADPNEPVNQHPSGEPMHDVVPLHQAAQRGCSAEIAADLLDAGADPTFVWHGRTPYVTARIYGNDAVADLLAERGHGEALSATSQALAACARGIAADTPLDPNDLSDEERRLPVRVAERPGGLDHLRALLASGLPHDGQDEMGLTPLQIALWQGLPGHVELLLGYPNDLGHTNAHGGDALGTLIHGSEFCPFDDRDHVGCARLLVAAGCRPPRRAEVDACGDESLAAYLGDLLDASEAG